MLMVSQQPTQCLAWWACSQMVLHGQQLERNKGPHMVVCQGMQFAPLHCVLFLLLEKPCLGFQSWLLEELTVLKQHYSFFIVEHLLFRWNTVEPLCVALIYFKFSGISNSNYFCLGVCHCKWLKSSFKEKWFEFEFELVKVRNWAIGHVCDFCCYLKCSLCSMHSFPKQWLVI